MTIGISKYHLLKIDPWQYDNQQDVLNAILGQCTELNPWNPIESAPLNRKLRLVHGGQLGRGQTDATLYSESDKQYFTHYQELPGDPD